MKEMTYQEIIDLYGECIFAPVGKSMLPLIREGLDTVRLIKVNRPFKKYDVILYQRANGQFVLHRIVRVHQQGLDLMGDNQWSIERDVDPKQVIALMSGIYRQEKYIPCTSLPYRLYARRRVCFRWGRKFIYVIKRFGKKILKK